MTTPEKPEALCFLTEIPEGSMLVIMSPDGLQVATFNLGDTSETDAQVFAQSACDERGLAYTWVHDPASDDRIQLEASPAETSIDPRLTDPIQLLRRRTEGGEHLCVFCIHGRMCEIASVARRFETLMPIISGCAGFERPSDD